MQKAELERPRSGAIERPRTQSAQPPPAVGAAVIAVFALCIFASAFLLFLVEPMVAKLVLPLAGGTPAVWTTSVLFFQSVLLAGYGYSHWLAMRLAWRWQALLHGILLLAPIAVLPIHLIPGWNPPTNGSPVGWLVLVLSVAVGLPFLVLSTTSPLVQHWFSRSGHPHAGDPYFLYRASNLGSALGLLSYPALIEPFLGLKAQAQVWRAGYFAFLVLVALCLAAVAWGRRRGTAPLPVQAAETKDVAPALDDRPLTWRRRARWVLLAAIPSTWMLAVTSYFTTVIRPIPLLWVIPLALYLFSFAIVFARKPLVSRYWLNRIFPFYALPLLGMILLGGGGPFWPLAALHFGAFFLAALLCHGELAADRPHPRHLTEFYWWLAVGGAAGGLLTAVVAPVIFNDFYEYPIAIIGAALLRPALIKVDGSSRARIYDFALPAAMAAALLLVVGVLSITGVLGALNRSVITNATTASDLVRVLIVFAIPAVVSAGFLVRPTRFGLAATAMLLLSLLPLGSQPAIFQERDFFGVHKVVSDPAGARHALIDGGVIHGIQLTDPALSKTPASYYAESGPVGDLFKAEQPVDSAWHVAVIGLGAGAIGCYAQPTQAWTFYEIDPVVVKIARDPSLFTFLRDCTPGAQVVLGDGRLTIADAPDHSYDLIVLDAFGSDAPPVHLLTKEAVQLYLSKLRPGGVLLFNVSNKYVNLAGLLGAQANAASLVSYERADPTVTAEQAAKGKFPSDWVVMARLQDALAALPASAGWHQLRPDPNIPVWTDDFSNVLSVTRLG